MSHLQVQQVSVDLAGRNVVDRVSFEVPRGGVTAVVGPNGSGKSTLCKTLYRALRPTAGTVLLDGRDLHRHLSPRQVAQQVAAVVQDGASGVEGNVHDAVVVGRTPHFGALGRASATDTAAVTLALERAGAAHLAERDFTSLSGGEKQRVLLARALAQAPQLLVLDEPTNHLDISAQLNLLALVGELSTTTSVTVVTVLHDLNLAAAACDYLLVLHQGRLVAQGAPVEVLTASLVSEVFGVHAHTGTNPLTGRPQISFAAQGQRPPRPTTTTTPQETR